MDGLIGREVEYITDTNVAHIYTGLILDKFQSIIVRKELARGLEVDRILPHDYYLIQKTKGDGGEIICIQCQFVKAVHKSYVHEYDI